MQHSAPLRVAVAGVGSFSQRVLIPGLIECPDADLVAIFGPTPAKTAQIARDRGVPFAYSDYLQMLDEARPAAVVVASPNDAHAPMALAAIHRGMAVFCEKPLALDARQAHQMVEAARAAGVQTAINFTYRSTSSMRHVARLLEQGRVGRLYHFGLSFWQNIRADPGVPLGYRMLRDRGGGALLDIGVHMMDLLRWSFGEIEAVCGAASTAIGQRPTLEGGRGDVTADDTASVVVRLRGGALGTTQVSQVAHGRQNFRRIELFGSEGSLQMEEDRTFGPDVRLARPGEIDFTLDPLPPDLDVAFDDFPRFHLSRIVAALRGESSDWPTFEDGLAAQVALEAVQESQRTGTWVRVPRT